MLSRSKRPVRIGVPHRWRESEGRPSSYLFYSPPVIYASTLTVFQVNPGAHFRNACSHFHVAQGKGRVGVAYLSLRLAR